MTTRRQFVDACRSMLDVKWVHQGRNPAKGVDCLGLITCAARDCDYQFQEVADYDRRPDPVRLLRETREHLTEIPIAQAREGSVVLIHFNRSTRQSRGAASSYHFGTLTADGTIVHGYALARRVVEHDVSEWRAHFTHAFDLPGILD